VVAGIDAVAEKDEEEFIDACIGENTAILGVELCGILLLFPPSMPAPTPDPGRSVFRDEFEFFVSNDGIEKD